jgi:Phage integrase, N-terminal SAM-like domain
VTADQPFFIQSTEFLCFDAAGVRQLCASVASQGGNSMARKVGQIIARGDRRWLIRVYLGRDSETKKRNYHNRTIHGSMREAQAYLTRKLRERDLGRDLEGAKITLNEYLDRWLETAVGPRVRPKTFQDYQGMLHRYVRPVLGERILAALRPLDLQAMYQHMTELGLSARTIRYAHVLRTRCDAAGGAVALVARESGRWTQSAAASSKRNAVSDC